MTPLARPLTGLTEAQKRWGTFTIVFVATLFIHEPAIVDIVIFAPLTVAGWLIVERWHVRWLMPTTILFTVATAFALFVFLLLTPMTFHNVHA